MKQLNLNLSNRRLNVILPPTVNVLRLKAFTDYAVICNGPLCHQKIEKNINTMHWPIAFLQLIVTSLNEPILR